MLRIDEFDGNAFDQQSSVYSVTRQRVNSISSSWSTSVVYRYVTLSTHKYLHHSTINDSDFTDERA